jgi:deazaflavin-dependent oxidoreductase (nitroreductase family)
VTRLARFRRRARPFLHTFNRAALSIIARVPLGGFGFGVLHHRGRRSGRLYATPVVARQTADGFLVPLTWGEQADWCRNVLAAGSATLQVHGTTHRLIEPHLIPGAAGRAAFAPWERSLLRLFGVDQYLSLRRAASA